MSQKLYHKPGHNQYQGGPAGVEAQAQGNRWCMGLSFGKYRGILSGGFWLVIVLACLHALSGIATVQGAEIVYANGTAIPLNPQYQSGDPAITFEYTYANDSLVFQNLEASKDSRYPMGLYLYHIAENRTELIPGTADDEHGADLQGTRIQGDQVIWRHMFFENVFHIYNSTTDTERVVPDALAWGALKTYHRQIGNISVDEVERADPTIDGDRLVWTQGFSTATNEPDTDLYMMNLTTGEVIPISEGPGRQERPSISGRYIVWEDTRNGVENPDIYLYDLETGKERPVCTDRSYQRYPVVSGDYVIWIDLRNGFDASQIRLYHIPTGTEIEITGNLMVRHEAPYISGNQLVFLKCIPYAIDPRGICQGFLYDIGTGTYTSLPETKVSQMVWGISGDRILYSEETDTSRQMYLFTLENRTPARPVPATTEMARNTSSTLLSDTPVTGTSPAGKSPGFDLLPCILAVSLAGLIPLCRRDR